MAYRIFTQEDLKSGSDAGGYSFSGYTPPYLCLNWNLFYTNYGPASAHPVEYGMRTADLDAYKADPTKLILRRHIWLSGIDEWYYQDEDHWGMVFPDV